VFVLELDAAPVISVPPEHLAALAACSSSELVADALRSGEVFRRLLAPGGRVIGPALLHYLERDPALVSQADVRALGPRDQATFDRLKAACSADDFEPKGFSPELPATFGAFDGGELLAIAASRVWAGAIAHLSVVAHPGARGRGHGSAVTSAAALHARRAGLLPQYRVLEQNTPSVCVARKLGFERYGWTLAVRLEAE
jgi:GNAT superfamily N-acetyltransferase